MTRRHEFRIVNVFTVGTDRMSGNPLCVLVDARGLSDAEMQAVARQLNLSETTFVLPADDDSTARVRIFTPGFEMPFAGHPTLGTASVLGELHGVPRVTLSLPAGRVPVVRGEDGAWTLTAAKAPVTRAAEATRAELAAMVGLPAAAIAADPLWVDTGVEQLVIPVATVDHVRAARPDPALIARHGFTPSRQEALAYVWAREAADPARIEARFFFTQHGAVIEDPATGSACANLGGYLIATGAQLPARATIWQGAAVGRPSRLGLHVSAARAIEVTGACVELGRGVLEL